MKNHKILTVLTPQFDPHTGGVQMSTYKMSKYFAENGQTPAVYSFKNEGHCNQSYAELFHGEYPGGHKNLDNFAKLKQVLESFKPDVVINQMPYEHKISHVLLQGKRRNNYLLLGCLRNTLFSVKLNIDAYRKKVLPKNVQPFFDNVLGRRVLLQSHKWRHAKDLKKILSYYDYFVMFGPPNKKEIEYFIGDYKSEKLAFMPNSIPDVLNTLPVKENVILHLGKLTPGRKRVDLLLPLWQKIHDKLPDWEFWIVGDGSEREKIEQRVIEEKIPRVRLFGKQPPYEYYEKASVFVMTSAVEGFPNVLIEAQSRGAIPVVMNSYPMVEWIINNREDGVLVNPFDINIMAKEINLLANDKSRVNLMSNCAIENAKRFEIESVGKKWLEFFTEKC